MTLETRAINADVLAAARLKIVLLYLIMGFIIFGVADYLVYGHILSLIQDVLAVLGQAAANRNAINAPISAALITQAIQTEVHNMNVAVGAWMLFTMIVAAYLLADVTLGPVKQAMERQKRFVADISHVLRTPLAIMKTNAEIALRHSATFTDQELVETVKSNLEEIGRVTKVIRFLLTFSTLQNQAAKLEFRQLDLMEAVGKAVKSAEPFAREKNVLLLSPAAPQGHFLVRGNPMALEELVTNLLNNAIAYTPAGGSVKVNLVKARHFSGPFGKPAFKLSIEDPGMGIYPGDLPNIFEPFYRGRDAARGNHGQNAGIGLAIVKEIAAAHGLTIAIESERGKGTKIGIVFKS